MIAYAWALRLAKCIGMALNSDEAHEDKMTIKANGNQVRVHLQVIHMHMVGGDMICGIPFNQWQFRNGCPLHAGIAIIRIHLSVSRDNNKPIPNCLT